VSRTAIIRLDAVKEARPFSDGTGEILLANSQTMTVARRRWRLLLEKLEA
jgi:DNA-binding LytR/AlgR family response regulator